MTPQAIIPTAAFGMRTQPPMGFLDQFDPAKGSPFQQLCDAAGLVPGEAIELGGLRVFCQKQTGKKALAATIGPRTGGIKIGGGSLKPFRKNARGR